MIPIIDFTNFEAHEERTGEELYEACRDVGFVYLKGCFDEERIKEMCDWVRRSGDRTCSFKQDADGTAHNLVLQSNKFFDLPEDVKQKAPHPPEGWKHRGYSGVGLEQISKVDVSPRYFGLVDPLEWVLRRLLSQNVNKGTPQKSATLPDYKESFDFGTEGDPVLENVWLPGMIHQISLHSQLNWWIAEEYLPGFRAVAVKFYQDMRQVQLKVLRALAIGFPGLDSEFFERCHENGDNQLRLLHYPSAPLSAFEHVGRCAPHSDFGTCTFLFQDDVGGLEIEDPNHAGVFIPAKPISGTIVFNLGDFLRHISNDTLKSTRHRVLAPPQGQNKDGKTPERFSMAYFCGGDREKVIDVLPGSYGPNNPRKYEPISVSQYIDMRMNALYSKE
ncbi:hypothetical protein P7C70_g4245, partial [Phenoliferia sp. Uapishka_3]